MKSQPQGTNPSLMLKFQVMCPFGAAAPLTTTTTTTENYRGATGTAVHLTLLRLFFLFSFYKSIMDRQLDKPSYKDARMHLKSRKSIRWTAILIAPL